MEAKHLTFSYGKNTVLKDVSAKFKEKGITTLLGANGSGKSTLFNICTKNLTPERGIIILDGENIFDINQKKFAGKVAIVHQQNRIMGDINVRQLVSYGRTPYMKLMRGYDKEDNDAIDWAIDVTGLRDVSERPVVSLSGGQRQRVWIAMSLAQKSQMLFLDEPTTYLDIKYQIELLELIRNLNRELGITIVMVLHDINQAIKYSDRVIGLKSGKIKFEGAPNDVITDESVSGLYDIELAVESFKGLKVVMPKD